MNAIVKSLFQPDAEFLHIPGLDLKDAMVSLLGNVMLVVSNPQNTPVHLQEGQLLAQVQLVDWVQKTKDKVISTPGMKVSPGAPTLCVAFHMWHMSA